MVQRTSWIAEVCVLSCRGSGRHTLPGPAVFQRPSNPCEISRCQTCPLVWLGAFQHGWLTWAPLLLCRSQGTRPVPATLPRFKRIRWILTCKSVALPSLHRPIPENAVCRRPVPARQRWFSRGLRGHYPWSKTPALGRSVPYLSRGSWTSPSVGSRLGPVTAMTAIRTCTVVSMAWARGKARQSTSSCGWG